MASKEKQRKSLSKKTKQPLLKKEKRRKTTTMEKKKKSRSISFSIDQLKMNEESKKGS